MPPDLYPVGRLDYDSEGLLILTNDKSLNHRLLDPQFAHEREYWVQVEGAIDQRCNPAACNQASPSPSTANPIRPALPADLIHRCPTSSGKKSSDPLSRPYPDQLDKTDADGRKEPAGTEDDGEAGFPTLRLIRHRIEKISLEGCNPAKCGK